MMDENCLTEQRLVVHARTPVSVPTGTNLVVKGTVHSVFLRSVDPRQMLCSAPGTSILSTPISRTIISSSRPSRMEIATVSTHGPGRLENWPITEIGMENKSATDASTYQVKPGDTLVGIALKY